MGRLSPVICLLPSPRWWFKHLQPFVALNSQEHRTPASTKCQHPLSPTIVGIHHNMGSLNWENFFFCPLNLEYIALQILPGNYLQIFYANCSHRHLKLPSSMPWIIRKLFCFNFYIILFYNYIVSHCSLRWINQHWSLPSCKAAWINGISIEIWWAIEESVKVLYSNKSREWHNGQQIGKVDSTYQCQTGMHVVI